MLFDLMVLDFLRQVFSCLCVKLCLRVSELEQKVVVVPMCVAISVDFSTEL